MPGRRDAGKIRAPILFRFAELDTRINKTWIAVEAALKAAGAPYAAHICPGVNHGFHNDWTPRCDAAAAKTAWDRTIANFRAHLG